MYNRNIPVSDIYGVLVDMLKSRNEEVHFIKEDIPGIYNMLRNEMGAEWATNLLLMPPIFYHT